MAGLLKGAVDLKDLAYWQWFPCQLLTVRDFSDVMFCLPFGKRGCIIATLDLLSDHPQHQYRMGFDDDRGAVAYKGFDFGWWLWWHRLVITPAMHLLLKRH